LRALQAEWLITPPLNEVVFQSALAMELIQKPRKPKDYSPLEDLVSMFPTGMIQ